MNHRNSHARSCRPLLAISMVLAVATVLSVAPRGAQAFITPAGYIHFDQAQTPKFQLNGGLGGMFPGYGSLFVSGDIFITPKLSIPVGLQGFGSWGGGVTAYAGVRYRVLNILSLGGGIGGAIFAFRFDEDIELFGDFRFCLELALGKRLSKRFGISFNFRPTFGTAWPVVFLPLELDFAIFVSQNWAFTIALAGGPQFGYFGGAFGYGGGYVGFAGTF